MAEVEQKRKKKRKGPKVIFFNVEDTQYPSIPRCCKRLGWQPTESRDKNLLFWCDNNVGVEYCLSMNPWQFVNHFPGTFSISRKIELSRSIDRMQRLFPEIYNFHPLSFIVPTQTADLQRYMQEASMKKRTFIVKPDLGAQGRGIWLVMDPEELYGCEESSIAQQYITPSLLDGLKFDFRIYALISSIDPLRVYILKEGMTRFCTEKYRKPRPSNLKDVFAHLTNYSLNKKNEHFQQPTNAENPDTGHKRSLSSVFGELQARGHDMAAIQSQIDQLIVLTVISGHPFISHHYRTCVKVEDGKSRCFEILGFDVMLDKKMKPWLLEVNHSPSLLCESPFDKDLKDTLITDALRILDLDPAFKKKTIAYERARTVQRISGQSSDSHTGKLFNPERESEIARETQWRQIYPIREDPSLQLLYESVLEAANQLPMAPPKRQPPRSEERQFALNSRKKRNHKQSQRPPVGLLCPNPHHRHPCRTSRGSLAPRSSSARRNCPNCDVKPAGSRRRESRRISSPREQSVHHSRVHRRWRGIISCWISMTRRKDSCFAYDFSKGRNHPSSVAFADPAQ
jgi:tubulin polyglutamylase TTLL6/13